MRPASRRQGTREGYPYHGRLDGFASALVHGRGAPCGYPGVGTDGRFGLNLTPIGYPLRVPWGDYSSVLVLIV